MSDITTKALLDKGFEPWEGKSDTHYQAFLAECIINVIMDNAKGKVLQVFIDKGNDTDDYTVPNCKTLEDLDSLIILFQ